MAVDSIKAAVLIGCFVLAWMASPVCSGAACPPWQSVVISDAFFHSNGSVEDQETNLLYPPHSYWAESKQGVGHLRGCPCKLDKPCLRKCCAKSEAMDNETLECVPYNESQHWFRPNVSADPKYQVRLADHDQFGLVYGNFCFGWILEPHIYEDDKFYINFTDGTLSIPMVDKFNLDVSHYCLEFVTVFDLYLPYVCFEQIGSQDSQDICFSLRYTIYPLGMSISIFFLIISFVIYATTQELRNLHGKCLMCHILSLLVAYLFLATVQSSGEKLSFETCTAFGFVIYFALLCSFFWLNIMCIDIYIAFSSFIPPRANASEMKKFMMYVIYAWGLPFIIIIVTAIMELHPGISNSYLKPQFKNTCWFKSFDSRLAYFIAPVGVIVFCNVILFILTAVNIHKVNRETSILQRGSSSRNREDKIRMKLYIKLSIVMGVSWILEIVSYLVGGSKCIWLFTDTVNTLQGFFIFLIFVCKRNVREIMKKRLRRLMNKLAKMTVSTNDDKEEDGEQSTTKSGGTASTNLPSVELQNRLENQQKD